jgi:pimeloyl-ACP methyl ester carboxylesterase
MVKAIQTEPDPSLGPSGSYLEAYGFLYSESTLAGMSALDLKKLQKRPAQRALVISRDDIPGDAGLTEHLKSLGVDATYREIPGYAAMMVEAHLSVLPDAILDSITSWLGEAHPPTSTEALIPPTTSVSMSEPWQGPFREGPVIFGEHDNLFGILAEPQSESEGSTATSRPAILMLNVGTNHRVGPNRMYVKMARSWAQRGYPSLRFDLAGIGDSRAADGYSATRLYSKGSVDDVRRAMDALSARKGYDQFVLIGLCSGAFVAFQTALADERVVGQVLMNPRHLTSEEGEKLEKEMKRAYKSSLYYRQALKNPESWRRLLRGELDVRGVASRLGALASARARRALTTALGLNPHEDDVLSYVRQLCQRGTDTFILVSPEDDGLDYLEYHLGSRGSKLQGQPNFELQFVDNSDHTFTQIRTQEALTETVYEHLERLSANRTKRAQ